MCFQSLKCLPFKYKMYYLVDLGGEKVSNRRLKILTHSLCKHSPPSNIPKHSQITHNIDLTLNIFEPQGASSLNNHRK